MTNLQRGDSSATGRETRPRMRVGVLGPITLERAGGEIEIGPRLRRLLAALVVARGESVSADRLADVVWDGDPPASAGRTLPSYVTRLRRALDVGTDVLRYREPGYALDVSAIELDAECFEAETDLAVQYLRAADATSALTSVKAALELWRGSAYAGLEDEWFRPEAVRLEGRRDEARLLQGEALLAAGDHEHAVAEADALVAAAPLNEAPRLLLMRALYASGCQAEAMRVLRNFRKLLVDEVGLDPSAEIVELESRIARGERRLASAVSLRGYEIHERIGSGAFAVVHRALQPGVDRDVAVKIIRAELADRPEFILRFEHEAHLAARLEHPHIVPLYDYWRMPGTAYLVMRLLRGGSVADALRRSGPFSRERTLEVVREIAGALDVAHRCDVVHRDVKPANILLDDDGHSYLADFGIATAIRAIDNIEIESPAYSAPEQLRHELVGPAADVLSLAITVFEMLTGRLPFSDSPTRADLVRCQLESPVPPVSATRTDLPAAVDDVLARATAKAAGDRHPSAAVFAAELSAALDSPDAPSPGSRRLVRATAPPNPYVGMHAFGEADANRFNGRESLVAELADRVAASRVVTVVGPSGTGKSSVVRAGLLPSLRKGSVPGSDSWFITTMLPGSDPFDALERALLSVAVQPPGSLRDQLAQPGGLVRAIRRVLPTEEAQVLIVIDQFEELFTQADTADERRFLDELATALKQPDCPLRIVATLRADHFDRPLAHREIAPLIVQGLVPIMPMSADEIERAVVAPARAADVDVEPALVAELVAAVSDRPASLPMLQFCLSEAFDRRVSAVMMLSTYRDNGGLTGAVAARADRAVFVGDDSVEDERVARRLFGRLVHIGDDGAVSRRRARRPDLAQDELTLWMLDAFAKARLLSAGTDPVTHEPTIEIAHEALLREWPRLRGWIDADRTDLRIVQELSSAATAWQRSDHDSGDLARGGRLETAVEFRDRRPDLLSPSEREWLDDSVATRDAADRDRKRRARRLQRVAALAGALAVLAIAATIVALAQRNDADRRAQDSRVQRLTTEAVASQDEDADLAILLALAAHDASELGSVPGDVVGALHETVQSSRLIARLDVAGGSAALSADGRTMVYATAGEPPELTLVDVESGDVLDRHALDRPPVELAFSPGGTSLAIAYGESDEVVGAATDAPSTAIEVLAIGSWLPIVEFDAECCLEDIRFSPDDRYLAAELHYIDFADDAFIVDTAVFDLGDPARPPSIHVGYELGGWIPDGPALARFESPGNAVEFVAPITQERVRPNIAGFNLVVDVDVDRSGDRIAVVTADAVEIRDRDGSLFFTLPSDVDTSTANSVRYTPDGRSVITYGFGSGLTVTEVESKKSTVLGAGRAAYRRVAVSDDGTTLAAIDHDQFTLWSIGRSGPTDLAAIPVGAEPFGMRFSDDSRTGFVATSTGTAQSFDVRSGRQTELATSDLGRFMISLLTVVGGLGECDQFRDANDRWVLVGTTFTIGRSAGCDRAPSRLIDISGAIVGELPFHTGPSRFGNRGTISADLLAWTDEGQVGLYDVVAGRSIGSFAGNGFDIEQPQFSPDGTMLAFGSEADGAHVIDVERVLDGAAMDDAVVVHIAFDGTVVRPAVVGADMLVTAHDSGELNFWDLETGEHQMTIDNPTGHSPVLAFTPDERYLYYEAPDLVMRRMPTDIDELVHLARTRVQRGFTADECATYFPTDACPDVA